MIITSHYYYILGASRPIVNIYTQGGTITFYWKNSNADKFKFARDWLGAQVTSQAGKYKNSEQKDN